MSSDLWQEQDYNEILAFTEQHLWLLVQENAHIHKPQQVVCNFAQLRYGDLRLLQSIYFLLSPHIQRLVHHDAPFLLRHFPQSSTPIISETKGFVRGKIDWSKTLKLRWRCGEDSTLFVSRAAAKTSAIPELQALKYLLLQISRLSADVLETLPGKETPSNYHKDEKWKDNIRYLHLRTNAFLQNVYLRDVIPPVRISGVWMQRVRCARATHSAGLFKSLNLYYRLFVRQEQETLRECVANGVLKPLNRDTLYEIYILFLTDASIEQTGWRREGVRLIGYGKGAVASYKNGDQTLRVYYQTLPSVLAASSLYAELLRNYGFDASLRRPDMVLEFRREDTNFVLIEVKRSENKDYIVDSIYKVFGYLKDFGSCFENRPFPHGILVAWKIGADKPMNDIIALLDRQSYQQFIERFVLPTALTLEVGS